MNNLAGSPVRQVYLRLSDEDLEFVHEVAAELGIPVASAMRRLLQAAATERRRPSVTGPAPASNGLGRELEIHLLVAIEQVIALIESFVPAGPGAAQRLLPEAVLAAQRRMEL